MNVRMELSKIIIQEMQTDQIIVLKEVDGERKFPIVIGPVEAAAINRRLRGEAPARPYTHELLANVITQLGGELERIDITELKEHTFFARLVLRNDQGESIEIDSRPSDAIALGIAYNVPIFVAEPVLDEAC